MDEHASSSGVKKLGLFGLVAAAGAGLGLLLTTKPKRLRQAVSSLRGDALDEGRPMPQEVSDQFEARRRERRERREQRQHATS